MHVNAKYLYYRICNSEQNHTQQLAGSQPDDPEDAAGGHADAAALGVGAGEGPLREDGFSRKRLSKLKASIDLKEGIKNEDGEETSLATTTKLI